MHSVRTVTLTSNESSAPDATGVFLLNEKEPIPDGFVTAINLPQPADVDQSALTSSILPASMWCID